MGEQTKQFYEFGKFRLDVGNGLLWRDREVVALTPKAFELLLVLAQSGGRVIPKDELMSLVWPDSFVEEANLSHQVFTLRKALGDDKDGARYIETIPRRGYRFSANITEVRDESVDIVVSEHSRSRLVIEDCGVSDKKGLADFERDKLRQTLTMTRDQRKWSRRTRALLALISSAMLIGLAFALYVWISGRSRQLPTGSGLKSIAVLPFKPLVAESRDEALEMGMAETLITRLSNLREIAVRPTSAVRKYNDIHQDAVAAGRELQVESVLDASIQKSGDRLRVVARLVQIKDGRTLWADTFDERFTDIFGVQDRISERLASALALRLTNEKRKILSRRYTESVEAYELYTKGRYFWEKFTEDSLKKSVGLYEQAITKDPEYALAYAGLANAYNVLGANHLSPTEVRSRVKSAAERACDLDDNLAEAHVALGACKYFYDWDWAGAEREFKRAMDLDPDYIDSYELYAYVLRIIGRFDEALVQIKKAEKIDPVSLLVAVDQGETLRLARRPELAIDALKRTGELDPNFSDGLPELGLAYAQIGENEKAVRAVNKAIDLSRGGTQAIAALGQIHALAGRKTEARKIIAELGHIAKQRYVSPLEIAKIYATLGAAEEAFEWLEKAFEERACWLIELGVEPCWDKLRSDPRFPPLLRHVGLPQ